MSSFFISRQPVFDKNMKLYGYELQYQQDLKSAEINKDQITATLLDNVFYAGFKDLIGGVRGFISVSEKLIIDQLPKVLPKDRLVIQISDSANITNEFVLNCKKLKDMRYTLAIPNFEPGEMEKTFAPVMPYVGMIKVNYDRITIAHQYRLINKYRQKLMLVANGIKTMEDFRSAIKMGYHLFSGSFYSHPIVTNTKTIGSLTNNLVQIATELEREEPDYRYITKIFESDVELLYKLLRRANSAYYGTQCEVTSIRQALVHVGTHDLRQWIHIMLIKGIQNAENEELVKASLIRGKLLALLADKMDKRKDQTDFFISGIFSSIDVLLDTDMDKVLAKLPLSQRVEDALLGVDNEIRAWLNAIIGFEKTQWDALDEVLIASNIDKKEFMSLYMDALKWCLDINIALF